MGQGPDWHMNLSNTGGKLGSLHTGYSTGGGFWKYAPKGGMRALHVLKAHFNYVECLLFYLKLI